MGRADQPRAMRPHEVAPQTGKERAGGRGHGGTHAGRVSARMAADKSVIAVYVDLDMVGDAQLFIRKEPLSGRYARFVVDEVWAAAARIGVREFDFYTVLFGTSRLLGVSANVVWARALGQPIERPKSLTTKMLEAIAGKAKPG